MRLGFAGTPAFAATALQALIAAKHEVTQVLTQPDRPAGRGLKLQASAVKSLASQHGLPVMQPAGLRLDGRFAADAHAARAALQAAAPDVMVVAAYGLLLPPWLLELPRWGCLNIHASLLPRWRGAAPIQRAIEAGDSTTGISIMQMDDGLDTGDVLLARTAADRRRRHQRDPARQAGGIGGSADRRSARSPWRRRARRHAAKRRRRDLRPQDRQARGRARLARQRQPCWSAGCAPSTRFPARRSTIAAPR